MTATLTIRELCMEYLVSAFKSMQTGQPTDNPYNTTWSKVEREPYDYTGSKKQYALVVQDLVEKKYPKMLVMYCDLLVVVEFYAYLQTGTNRAQAANVILGDIQRKVQEDITCGGNSLNIVEVSNELRVDSPEAHEVTGCVYFDLQYRHAINDPRAAV